MTPKILKTHKIIVLWIITALMIVPAVSAKKGLPADSGENLNKGATTTDYIIAPTQGNSPSNDNVIHLDTIYSIVQGQTRIHTASVGSAVKYLEVDLYWYGITKNSPALTIYTLQESISEPSMIFLTET